MQKASDFSRLGQREHVLERPDSYLGLLQYASRPDYVASADGVISLQTVTFPPGLMKCVDEVMSNAVDNVIRALISRSPQPEVSVRVSGWEFSVRNSGASIPIEMHETEGVYVPQLIFGTLLTSSTYGRSALLSGGRNGYGAKLVNICSTKFSIVIQSKISGLRYTQTWRDNMATCEPPVITAVTGCEDLVEVTYVLDHARFHLKGEGYPVDAVCMMRRVAMDATTTCRAAITFNDTLYPCITPLQYSVAVFGAGAQMRWATADKSDAGLSTLVYVATSAEGGGCLSYVNGIRTKNGGVHVEAVWKRLHKAVTMVWPGTSANDMKANIGLMVVASVRSPTFVGQMKEECSGPSVLIDKLAKEAIATLRECPRLKQMFAKRAKASVVIAHLPPPLMASSVPANDHIMDAGDAGGPEAKKCTLWIIEGHSALDHVTVLIGCLPGGRARNGVMEDRGVIMNGFEDTDRVRKGRDVRRLHTVLGDATSPRYGYVVLLSDQDVDGKRINALKAMILWRFFPHIITERRLSVCHTPIIRVRRDLVFYTEEEYTSWAAENPRHTARYMKGLGTSTRADIQADSKRMRVVPLLADADLNETFKLFFDYGVDARNMRRALVKDAHINGPALLVHTGRGREISNYLRHEYVYHCIHNNLRSLPGIDGLKVAQRKVLWACWKRWAANHRPEKGIATDPKEAKVAQLTGYVAETMSYHHDERNLAGIIVQFASPYYSNYALLEPRGNFGTMYELVAGAASGRYIHTRPTKVFSAIFPPADVPLLTFTKVENEECEPDFLLPVVPICILNGTRGIGTGFRTFFPPHDPKSLVEWFLSTLRGRPARVPRPFYRYFTGRLEVVDTRTRKCMESVEDADDNSPTGKFILMEANWSVIAINKKDSSVDVRITNLPPERTLSSYLSFLEKAKETGLLSDFKDRSEIKDGKDCVDLLLSGIYLRSHFLPTDPNFTRAPVTITHIPIQFCMRRCNSMHSLNTVDEHRHVIEHASVEAYLKTWYVHRLRYYDLRTALEIERMESEMEGVRTKARFFEAVLDGTLRYSNRPETDILVDLAALEIPVELYRSAKITALRTEAITEMRADVLVRAQLLEAQRLLTGKDLWEQDLLHLLEVLTALKT
jgi:DNA topoisomerase-2